MHALLYIKNIVIRITNELIDNFALFPGVCPQDFTKIRIGCVHASRIKMPNYGGAAYCKGIGAQYYSATSMDQFQLFLEDVSEIATFRKSI